MNEKKLIRCLELAKNVSKLSNHRVRMGAVIVRNGNPISVGCNEKKTHPLNYSYANSIHAEQKAIMNCSAGNIKGSTMIIYREHGRNRTPLLARPCQGCMKLLRESGIKRVIYTIGEFPFFKIEDI
jgi:deoxycytidylate deaminase